VAPRPVSWDNRHLQIAAKSRCTISVLRLDDNALVEDMVPVDPNDCGRIWRYRKRPQTASEKLPPALLIGWVARSYCEIEHLQIGLLQCATVAAVCLSLAFFFAELIVAPISAVPMDMAPRYAGSASSMMNFGFGVAGLVLPSSFGYLVDRTGSRIRPSGLRPRRGAGWQPADRMSCDRL
jgi:hypothetical protein